LLRDNQQQDFRYSFAVVGYSFSDSFRNGELGLDT